MFPVDFPFNQSSENIAASPSDPRDHRVVAVLRCEVADRTQHLRRDGRHEAWKAFPRQQVQH